MNIKEIKELLQLIDSVAIEEFEMERSGLRIRVRKTLPSDAGPPPAGRVEEGPQLPAAQPAKPREEDKSIYFFKAPIVGTFYGSPKPDAEAFVRPGDQVHKGTVLCIIEAMKLFNQIECDVDGEIIRLLVENGQPVEYGEPLFEIRVKP
jgi:oxaloacetate decarboxylase (Na+ extruding) subunit alpha